MDEPGNHHSQQTDTRTENQTLHILTHRWMLNNENASHKEGSMTLWGLLGVTRGGTVTRGVGSWRWITWGEMADIGDGEEGSKPHCHVCTYATGLHALHIYPKPKCNKIYVYIKCIWKVPFPPLSPRENKRNKERKKRKKWGY